ncbi:site-specific integrase, partial [bacterium]|nr:site-specific integrase [bacterium]
VKRFVDDLKRATWIDGNGNTKQFARDSVRIIVATLRKILSEAVDDGLLANNSASRIGTRYRELPRVHEIDPFSEEEILKFLEVASENCPYWFPYFATLFHAGLRPGEGAALHWKDVDFNRRVLNIRATGSAGRIGSTKTGKSRQVEMSDFLYLVLQDLLLDRKKEWKDHIPEFVFCTSSGTMADICNIRDQERQAKGEKPQRKWTLTFSELLQLAGLKPRGLHQFRHSFATIHLQNSTPIEWVSRQLGHADVATTYKHYYHYFPERQKAKFTHVLPAIGKGSTNNNLIVMKAK